MQESAAAPKPGGISPQDIRLVLVDTREIVSAGLTCLLEEQRHGFVVVGLATSGHEAIDVIAESPPDLVVLDYSLGDTDAPRLIPRIHARWPRLPTLVLAVHDNVHFAIRALRAGALGYVVTDEPPETVAHAIRETSAGRGFVTERMRTEVDRRFHTPLHGREGLEKLSPREFQLLRFIVGGHSLSDAAEKMGVTDSSVSTYRRRLLDKLDAESNAQLVRIGMAYGLEGHESA